MRIVSLEDGGHTWEKQNLVTIGKGRGKMHDVFKCSGCGIMGRSYTLGFISITERYSPDLVKSCSKFSVPARIKITLCTAFGPEFVNLAPGSEHDVVTPPDNYKNDGSGVWVMGVSKPVKVLNSEYIAL